MALMGWCWQFAAILAFAVVPWADIALAEPDANNEAAKKDIAFVLSSIMVVKATTAYCDEVAPRSHEGRQGALSVWRRLQRIDQFEKVMTPALARTAGADELMRKLQTESTTRAKT